MRETQENYRFMMPGKIYDVVRHHENVSFDKARHWIRRSKVNVIESSGNVFRHCTQPLTDTEAHNILQQSYTTTKKENLKLAYLSKINSDGLYQTSSSPFYNSTSDRLNKPAIQIPDTLVELECFYESLIKNLSDGQTSLQGFNISNTVSSSLHTFPYHTSPKVNPRLESQRGINLPIFHLGTHNSLEPLHKTFGLLDRVDVLHWGACRLWLVVQLTFEHALELRLSGQLTRRGSFPSWCPMPTYHREFAIVPSLLRKWNIPFEIVVQMPGDLVHLRDWVPHQVIDLGTNVSETVSVGSTEWNMSADSSAFLNCPCGTKPYVGDNNFGGNRSIYTKVEVPIPRSRPMPCTHVAQAIEAAKKEHSTNVEPGCYRDLPLEYDNRHEVPILKEYRKPTALSRNNKCYGCGKRSTDLWAHMNRHIMCRAKFNATLDLNEKDEELVTDESDEELECRLQALYGQKESMDEDARDEEKKSMDEDARDEEKKSMDEDARYNCAFCWMPFETRRSATMHVEKMHRKKILKRGMEEPKVVVKRRRTKQM